MDNVEIVDALIKKRDKMASERDRLDEGIASLSDTISFLLDETGKELKPQLALPPGQVPPEFTKAFNIEAKQLMCDHEFYPNYRDGGVYDKCRKCDYEHVLPSPLTPDTVQSQAPMVNIKPEAHEQAREFKNSKNKQVSMNSRIIQAVKAIGRFSSSAEIEAKICDLDPELASKISSVGVAAQICMLVNNRKLEKKKEGRKAFYGICINSDKEDVQKEAPKSKDMTIEVTEKGPEMVPVDKESAAREEGRIDSRGNYPFRGNLSDKIVYALDELDSYCTVVEIVSFICTMEPIINRDITRINSEKLLDSLVREEKVNKSLMNDMVRYST
jgi:hypothetical protein